MVLHPQPSPVSRGLSIHQGAAALGSADSGFGNREPFFRSDSASPRGMNLAQTLSPGLSLTMGIPLWLVRVSPPIACKLHGAGMVLAVGTGTGAGESRRTGDAS